MKCPACSSNHVNKNGWRKGKQNYICYDCKKQFIDTYDRRGYVQEIKQECLEMHESGMGLREIERIKGVHHTTIINWLKQTKEVLSDSDRLSAVSEPIKNESTENILNQKLNLEIQSFSERET